MIGETKVEYCPICRGNTEHLQGCYKYKEINGELFYFNASLSDTLRKISSGFKDFVITERDGVMSADTPNDFAQTRKGGLDFEEIFSPQVRSLKCVDCGHLIRISRLP